MLWAKALRSPIAYGRIEKIDVSKALALPGVHGVVTGADVKGQLIGRKIYDMPVLADEVVRFIGEKVAVVAAETEEIAEAAIALIEVDYHQLERAARPARSGAVDRDHAASQPAKLPRLAARNHGAEQRVRRSDLDQGRCRGGIPRRRCRSLKIPSRPNRCTRLTSSRILASCGRIAPAAPMSGPVRKCRLPCASKSLRRYAGRWAIFSCTPVTSAAASAARAISWTCRSVIYCRSRAAGR